MDQGWGSHLRIIYELTAVPPLIVLSTTDKQHPYPYTGSLGLSDLDSPLDGISTIVGLPITVHPGFGWQILKERQSPTPCQSS